MKYLVLFVCCLFFYEGHTKPSLISPLALVGPAAPGALLKGPSSATTLLGPDGSAISASAIGGTVAAGPALGGVVKGAVAPVLAHTVLAAPVLGAPASAILAGPSGTVISPGLGAPLIAGHSNILGGWIG